MERRELDSDHAVAVEDAAARGNGAEIAMAQLALAVLHNGLGNYTMALHAAEQASEHFEPPYVNLALPELVEAAIRADEPERAAVALHHLSSRAEATRTAWALGLAACAHALCGTGPAVEEWYREAIEQLRQLPAHPEFPVDLDLSSEREVREYPVPRADYENVHLAAVFGERQ